MAMMCPLGGCQKKRGARAHEKTMLAALVLIAALLAGKTIGLF